ncbi:hypothetical protein [Streptomyces spinoverrucosus]|nr:hypothetical protein [Streptomyces spinoverrucosus]
MPVRFCGTTLTAAAVIAAATRPKPTPFRISGPSMGSRAVSWIGSARSHSWPAAIARKPVTSIGPGPMRCSRRTSRGQMNGVHDWMITTDPSLEIELARIVEQGRQRGEIRAGVDRDQAGQLLAACYFSTILRWIREEPAPFDLHERLAGALDIILLGLLADEAHTGEP